MKFGTLYIISFLSILLNSHTVYAQSLESISSTTISNIEFIVETKDQQELTVYHYPAEGSRLIIWIAPGYGFNSRSHFLAKQLAQRGVEVWQVDLAESLFETHTTSFMRSLQGDYIHTLINAAHAKTNKEIFLISRSYGAIPTLRGVHQWQEHGNNEIKLGGIIFFSADLYQGIPSLGNKPSYLPVALATNVPIMLYQAAKSGTRWRLPHLLTALRSGGSPVYFKILPEVIALLYQGDTSTTTINTLASIPDEVLLILELLSKTPTTGELHDYQMLREKNKPLDDKLKKFSADLSPQTLNLDDINGAHFYKKDYKGKVVIVNFWATWCPPCVEEIPSLNRLRKKMVGKNFELISVNYSESPERVREFMKQVRVDFPVLLDLDGQTSAQWNVIAFPSTFIIAPNGKIVYGVNSAIEWDSPEVIEAINSLLK